MQKKYDAIRKELGIPVRQAFEEAHSYGTSQVDFAEDIGVCVRTLRNWLKLEGATPIPVKKRNYRIGNFYNGLTLEERAQKLGYMSLFDMVYDCRQKGETYSEMAKKLNCRFSSIGKSLTRDERLSLPRVYTDKMKEHNKELCIANNKKRAEQRAKLRKSHPYESKH